MNGQSLLITILALYLQTLIEPYLRWFTPDLFFLALLYQILIYKNMGFVMLFIVSIFYDAYSQGILGSTILSIAIVLYFIELTRFHMVRAYFFSSTTLVTIFYFFYLLLQHIIIYGVGVITSTSILFVITTVLATSILWMLLWRLQAKL